jgi:hypothetical protein
LFLALRNKEREKFKVLLKHGADTSDIEFVLSERVLSWEDDPEILNHLRNMHTFLTAVQVESNLRLPDFVQRALGIYFPIAQLFMENPKNTNVGLHVLMKEAVDITTAWSQTYRYLYNDPDAEAADADTMLTSTTFASLKLSVNSLKKFFTANADLRFYFLKFIIESDQKKRMFLREFTAFSQCIVSPELFRQEAYNNSLKFAAKIRLISSSEGRSNLARCRNATWLHDALDINSSSSSSSSSSSFSSSSSSSI